MHGLSDAVNKQNIKDTAYPAVEVYYHRISA